MSDLIRWLIVTNFMMLWIISLVSLEKSIDKLRRLGLI